MDEKLSRLSFLRVGGGVVAGACTLSLVGCGGEESSDTRGGRATAERSAARGEKVFLDYTQEELDQAYDQRVWAPNADELIELWGTESEAVRARMSPRTFDYGDAPVEKLDVYPASGEDAPIQLFIHGGAWRAGSKEGYAFPAPTFVDAGAHYVAVGFGIRQKYALDEMVLQVRSAVAWLYENASEFGGDRNRIYVSGHSSGAHLGGCVVTTDWEREFGVPRDVVKGAVLVSGMYDLRPVRLSSRNGYMELDEALEEDLSPQRHLDLLNCPVAIVFGENESPEFKRQSIDFAAACGEVDKTNELILVPNANHFEIPLTIKTPDLGLGWQVLSQMRLA